MNKKEILSLDDTELIAHAMSVEMIATKETNSRRGISKGTIKDYKWTVEEMVRRFDLDFDKLKTKLGASQWWDE